jgi:ankyrin repeat protein
MMMMATDIIDTSTTIHTTSSFSSSSDYDIDDDDDDNLHHEEDFPIEYEEEHSHSPTRKRSYLDDYLFPPAASSNNDNHNDSHNDSHNDGNGIGIGIGIDETTYASGINSCREISGGTSSSISEGLGDHVNTSQYNNSYNNSYNNDSSRSILTKSSQDEFPPIRSKGPIEISHGALTPNLLSSADNNNFVSNSNSGDAAAFGGGRHNKYNDADSGSKCEEDLEAIQHFLSHHHEMRLHSTKKAATATSVAVSNNLFECDPIELEDYRLYYRTNAANPMAMKQSFLYCIQTNDVILTNTIIRDVGIEHLLRHCMIYSGLYSDTAAKTTATTAIENEQKDANIFWLAAYYGSAQVLDLILETIWVHFAEIDMQSNYYPKDNVGGDDNIDNDDDDIDYQYVEKKAKEKVTHMLRESALSYDMSPLFIAAKENHKDVIALLLKYGVDPNEPNVKRKGTTPSIIAACENNTDALTALAESELTDFNRRNENRSTPLLAACSFGSIDAVRYLTHLHSSSSQKLKEEEGDDKSRVDLVVDCRCQNLKGDSCASVAVRYDRKDIVVYLCQIHDPDNESGIDINQQNIDGHGIGDTALHLAVKLNRCSIVTAMIEMIPRTCNMMALNKQGMNALHIAAKMGFIQIVKQMMKCLSIETMKEYDVLDVHGMTPLFYAVKRGFHNIVNILGPISDVNSPRKVQMEKKRRRETKNSSGEERGVPRERAEQDNKRKKFSYQPPLHVAVSNGFENIVYTLIHCGANVNGVDRGGHTALSLACKMGHFDLAKILIENGADAKIKSKRGKTPLAKARKYKRNEIIEYLEKYGASR